MTVSRALLLKSGRKTIKGKRRGDTISSKLFMTCLKELSKNLEWGDKSQHWRKSSKDDWRIQQSKSRSEDE